MNSISPSQKYTNQYTALFWMFKYLFPRIVTHEYSYAGNIYIAKEIKIISIYLPGTIFPHFKSKVMLVKRVSCIFVPVYRTGLTLKIRTAKFRSRPRQMTAGDSS